MKRSMKKLFTILLVLLFACKIFAAEGVVTFVKGKVEVKRNNNWIALKVGDKVAQSEVINTGFQSEAKVKLMNNVLYLGPVTRVTLSTLSSSNNKDKVNVYLSTGTIRSKINRTDTKRVSYTVRTPIAVASVRGTDLINEGPRIIECVNGRVAITNIERLSRPKKDKASKKADKGDEEAEETLEEETEELKEGSQPKDNASSTPAGDIDDELLSEEEIINQNIEDFSAGDTLPNKEFTISKQQKVVIQDDQLGIDNPTNITEESILNTVGKVSSAADKEKTGNETPVSSNNIVEETVAAPSTGSLIVNIYFKDKI